MPKIEDDNLMIIRGKYITAISNNEAIRKEASKRVDWLRDSFGRLVSGYSLDSDEFRKESIKLTDAAQFISEAQLEYCINQAEIDRLKPLTGF